MESRSPNIDIDSCGEDPVLIENLTLRQSCVKHHPARKTIPRAIRPEEQLLYSVRVYIGWQHRLYDKVLLEVTSNRNSFEVAVLQWFGEHPPKGLATEDLEQFMSTLQVKVTHHWTQGEYWELSSYDRGFGLLLSRGEFLPKFVAEVYVAGV